MKQPGVSKMTIPMTRKHTKLLLSLCNRTGWQSIPPKDQEAAFALQILGMVSLTSDPVKLVLCARVRNAGRRRAVR